MSKMPLEKLYYYRWLSVYGYVIFWPSKYFAKFLIFWAKLSSIPVHNWPTLYEMQARELGSSFKALRKGSVEKLKSSLDSESEKSRHLHPY